MKVKKVRKKTDDRIKKKEIVKENLPKNIPKTPSYMYFKHNKSLRPPYNVLIDTNFFSFALKQKIDIVKGIMDCLCAGCIVCVTDCVIAELEKLGRKHKMALSAARDPSFERLKCTHKGIYADDCLVERVQMHRCYIVATCDRDLKKRLRQIDGVPIMYVAYYRFKVEQLPEGYGLMF